MSPEDHHKEAERLLKKAEKLLEASSNPDAAGSSIRKAWRKEAQDLLLMAAVHAAFVVEKPNG